MTRHHGFEKTARLVLLPREWHDVRFNRRDDGVADVMALAGTDEPAGTLYDLSVGVTLEEITPNTEVRLRAVEFEPDGSGGWRVFRERPVDSAVHAVGHGRFTYHWKGDLASGRWVGVRVAQFGEADAHLTHAEADVFVWPH